MHASIGIMQGRLSPPVGASIQAFPGSQWEDEFARAREAGLDYVEWIFDLEDDANPIARSGGIDRMRALMAETGVRVPSVCADYFMSEPLLQGSIDERQKRAAKLRFLLRQCSIAGVERVILPFVDRSRINGREETEELVALLGTFTSILQETGVEIHLETSLPPRAFADLIDRLDHDCISINYDTGNSASLGYDPGEEFAAYGARIGSVHVKDRTLGGGTVPLGNGQADFPRIVRLLRDSGYAGEYTLQVARGQTGSEVPLAMANAKYWRDLLEAN